MRVRTAVIVACVVPAASLTAQRSGLTRNDAIRTAIDRGARLGVARADSAVAVAGLITARTRPNPSINGSYSKSVPQYHFSLDLPLDFPWIRQLRIRSAELGLQAAQLRYQF